MIEVSTDVAIVGAGTAGLNARREVQRAGKRWVLIESGVYGTTCARVGCMPSKLLIAAAEVARTASSAGEFGIGIAPEAIRVDGAAVMARVQRERDRFVGLVRKDVEALPAELRFHGAARFVGPTELSIDDRVRVRAQAVVIATGSRPTVPEVLRGLGELLLTTDTLFELRELPRSLAVFGTGAIGLELGQAMQALGVRVAFFNPLDELAGFSDPEVARRFRAYVTERYELALGYKELKIERTGAGCSIRCRDSAGQHHEGQFERVLSAAGRTPNLEALQLKAAGPGLELDERGGPRFDPETMQCGTTPLFIAGDASSRGTVLHEAVDEGAAAGANAARFPAIDRIHRRVPLRIGFTDPRVAVLGQRYAEAKQRAIVIGESSYEDQGRARVIAQAHGHVRVYVDRASGALVGAELFGPGVEHSAHLLAWAVGTRTPMAELLRLPVYHPTLEEGIRTALRDAARQLSDAERCPAADRGSSPGL
jgi:dihydrolipoamide dehydrogenase